MSEVGARKSLLRSKHAELSGIVTSRKRKLREFFAVCDSDGPLPRFTSLNLDASPTTPAEIHFLDVCDILQGRLFDEANLPARRQLRSETLKLQSPTRKSSPETRNADVSRKAGKLQRDGSRTRKSRATTPGAKSDAGQSTEELATAGQSMQRSTSKGSQTDLPADSAAVLAEIVEETFENAERPEPEIPDAVVPEEELESDRIKTRVESRPNSPGVDPRKAMPISAEDAAQLPEPLVEGLGSHDGQHKATTVHLPPKEVQERHLQRAEKAREQKEGLSLHLPLRDGGRAADPLSSPGSTIGAHSATTPALHDASTDTSPDNEGSRYEAERLEHKDDDVQTPPELKKTPEEVAEREEHDRILKAQIEISRDEILASSPAAADAQLRMEEQAASASDQPDGGEQTGDVDDTQINPNGLVDEAEELVEDVLEDEDEVVGVPTADDDTPVAGADAQAIDRTEIADSEAEGQTPVDAMDVDKAPATVKDSFETNGSLETQLEPGSAAPESSESSARPLNDTKKSTPLSTPRRTPSTPAAPPTMERMTTRVSSGAIRNKSVSEILGQIPPPNTKSAADSESAEASQSPSRSTTPQSPGTKIRSIMEKAKEKERSKLSTVVFAKQPAKPSSSETALVLNRAEPLEDVKDDYFLPLFLATAATEKRGVPSLDTLLATAHKTISTSNAYLPYQENQTTKVLKRIYSLQSNPNGKWSLRQPKRCPEPNRPTSHWDLLIQEAQWMRTDFREERKWKTAVARNLAHACAEWVEASPEDRQLLQVKATPPKTAEPVTNAETAEAPSQEFTQSTPDLVASGESDSPIDDFDEDTSLNPLGFVAPTAIFTLQDDDVVFGLRRSPATDKLLNELPMYGAPLVAPQSNLPTSEVDPDRFWRRPAVPLSKYVEGRMELTMEGPPRKRSRFEYEEEDDDEDQVVFGETGTKRPILPPEQIDVALFNPEHKHIRDRIHAGHQFRPPSEYPMPLQSFFECRTASQWTWAEDDELKSLVREYSYNWSLISSMLSSRSLFSSGAERRTPWECFERWIHLEGLPADMQKTHYFRAYNNRLEAAQRNVMAQAAQAPQQMNAQGQIQQARRRATTSIRVERRRNQKHLTLVDAMRKLAKKRETNIQKQQHAAGLAAMRKANEIPQARGPISTPQDFSKLKHEREEQIKERMALIQQRQEAAKRAHILQARNAAQNPQQQGAPNGAQPRGPAPVNGAMNPNGTPSTSGQTLQVPGQNRARGPMPQQMPGQTPMPNGIRLPQMPMNGVPQAQMQQMPGQLPVPNVDLATAARQISEQQRAAIQMRQQGQHPGQHPGQPHNSPPRMSAMSPPNPNFMPNMMYPNPNGVSTPPPNGLAVPSPGQAGSPRINHIPLQLSNGMVPQVAQMEAQIRQKFPNATNEQVSAMLQDTLKNNMRRQAQSAMNAAAGGNGMGNANTNGNGGQRLPNGMEFSPQLYAQTLRQQQQTQMGVAQGANQNQSGHTRAGSSSSLQGK